MRDMVEKIRCSVAACSTCSSVARMLSKSYDALSSAISRDPRPPLFLYLYDTKGSTARSSSSVLSPTSAATFGSRTTTSFASRSSSGRSISLAKVSGSISTALPSNRTCPRESRTAALPFPADRELLTVPRWPPAAPAGDGSPAASTSPRNSRSRPINSAISGSRSSSPPGLSASPMISSMARLTSGIGPLNLFPNLPSA
mmetsp:Transcript_27489/g.76828  ORF Transcript_27489/g.76828 Transcript_27489/m.76828 type:complete len:200 (+) Transcript_27489:423-1022(+)